MTEGKGKQVVTKLRAAVKNASEVVLATDGDGAEEPASYVLFGYGDVAQEHGSKAAKKEEKLTKHTGETEAVTISIAKRGGANAIQVSHRVLHKLY